MNEAMEYDVDTIQTPQDVLVCVTCPLSDYGFPCQKITRLVISEMAKPEHGFDMMSERRSESEIANQYKRMKGIDVVTKAACQEILDGHEYMVTSRIIRPLPDEVQINY